MAMPRTGQSHDRTPTRSLGFFLQCNGDSDSTTWSCNATAELRLLPQKEGAEPLSRRMFHNDIQKHAYLTINLLLGIQHIFYSKENDWGFSHFATMVVRTSS